MARKRPFSTFSLSFLDIMSCGFGAVALLFLIIKHDIDTNILQENSELAAEVNLLEEDLRIGREGLVVARNTLSDLDQQMVDAKGLASRIQSNIETLSQKIAELESQENRDDLQSLRDRIAQLKAQRDSLTENLQGNNARDFLGEGNRQYLTGMKMGGARIMILIDASASMLDERIVNIIRRRNMDAESKRQSKKWQRAIRTAEWITAQLPQQSRYQIYVFNTEAKALIQQNQGRWLNVSDQAELEQNLANLKRVVPEKGTNLAKAFAEVSTMQPDNLFLITDGLPTQGDKPLRGNNLVSAQQRVQYFNDAIDKISTRVTINTLLLPMEGDPLAAAAFWQLAQRNKGSFISPSEDWP